MRELLVYSLLYGGAGEGALSRFTLGRWMNIGFGFGVEGMACGVSHSGLWTWPFRDLPLAPGRGVWPEDAGRGCHVEEPQDQLRKTRGHRELPLCGRMPASFLPGPPFGSNSLRASKHRLCVHTLPWVQPCLKVFGNAQVTWLRRQFGNNFTSLGTLASKTQLSLRPAWNFSFNSLGGSHRSRKPSCLSWALEFHSFLEPKLTSLKESQRPGLVGKECLYLSVLMHEKNPVYIYIFYMYSFSIHWSLKALSVVLL